jgi:hypothetical protein
VVQGHVAAKTLAETLVPGEPRPWEEALRTAIAVGRALQPLHAAGLVHGALRPGTVLLPEGRPPELAQEALALSEPSRHEVTRSPQARVDLLYLSPEQAVGERLDARSDIFALGSLAYRLVTGRDAFEAETAQQILARVSHDRVQPPSQLVPELPPGVDDVFGHALATARKDRYADVGTFCDDLDEILAGRPPRHARPQVVQQDAGRFLSAAPASGDRESSAAGGMQQRRPAMVRVAAALLALGMVGGLELLRRELEAPDTAPLGPPTVDPDRREIARPSPDGLELPSLAPETARLAVDFGHPLETGTLVVMVDGSPVLERRLSAAVKKSLFGIKLREGRLREVIDVAPGRHEIAVRVSWGEDQRNERIAGQFSAGRTRRLAASLARFGKRLSLEWQ